jgi:DNA-binding NarL/FixJ family response regulator/tRNA A-37 threonylcarbamoyl transferase component Bud32
MISDISDSPTSTKHMRVMLVDDEAINRLGLKFLLSDMPRYDVVAEGSNGKEAIELAALHRPDVILMDISMPDLDGISAVKAIRKVSTKAKILMLTSRISENEVTGALTAGANGYCLKNSSPEQLMTALDVVCKGDTFLDSKVLPQILSGLSRPPKISNSLAKTNAYEILTERELEILAMRMDGFRQIEAAQMLNISLETLAGIEEEIKQKIVHLEACVSNTPQNLCHALVCPRCDSVFPLGTESCAYDGAQLNPEVITNRLGTTIGGKYVLNEFIGRGGGATVFKAHHRFLNQSVAVKIIHSELSTDFTMLQRFRGEAEVASKLDHPNIVKVHDFGLAETGTPYLVMELLEGVNLATYLRTRGRLDLDEFVSVFTQVCKALDYAHSHGLIHRDVKPGNVFLTEVQSGEPVVKLVDFGLAKAVDANNGSKQLTTYGQIVGTPGYMSPEVCRGEKESVASDIYALGCAMFQCLTGALPFLGESALDTMFKHIREEVPPLYPGGAQTSIEHRLDVLVSRCLQKNPNARFICAQEIISALQLMLV